MRTVKDIILRLRSLGYSQTRIAAAIGAPQPRISRWERGEAPDAADDALKLIKLLEEVEACSVAEEGQFLNSTASPLPGPGEGANSARPAVAPASIGAALTGAPAENAVEGVGAVSSEREAA